MMIRKLFTAMTLMLSVSMSAHAVVRITKISGDHQYKWAGAALTSPMVFQVRSASDDTVKTVALRAATGGTAAAIITNVLVDGVSIWSSAGDSRYDITNLTAGTTHTLSVYCKVPDTAHYTLDVQYGNVSRFVFNAYGIHNSAESRAFTINATHSTPSPQIAYSDDASQYHLVRVAVVDGTMAKPFALVNFSVSGSGQLVDVNGNLVRSLSRHSVPEGNDAVAAVEYRVGSASGVVKAQIQYAISPAAVHRVQYIYDGLTITKHGDSDNQTNWFGYELERPLSIKVTDGASAPISEQRVRFRLKPHAAAGKFIVNNTEYSGVEVETDTSGVASVRFKLDSTIANHKIVTDVPGIATYPSDLEFTVTAVTREPHALSQVSGDHQSGQVETRLSSPFVVKVTDANGEPMSGVEVGFSVSPSSGDLSSTRVSTNSNGLAETTLTFGIDDVTYSVTASVTGVSDVVFTATAVPEPPPSDLNIYSGDNQTAFAGSRLARAISVRVYDANGNVARGVEVDFHVTAGGGSVRPSYADTNSRGIASTRWTLGPEVGTQHLEASIRGLTRTFTATSLSTETSLSVVSGDGQDGLPNAKLENRLVVKLTRADGAALASKTVRFQVQEGGGRLSEMSVKTDRTGEGRVAWWLGKTGNQVVSANYQTAKVEFTASIVTKQLSLESANGQEVSHNQDVTITARLALSNGEPLENKSINFRVRKGGGTIRSEAATVKVWNNKQVTVRTDSDGRATAILKVGYGNQVVRVWHFGHKVEFTAIAPTKDGTRPTNACVSVYDVNCDTRVDNADLRIVAAVLTGTDTNERADVNKDGTTDLTDLLLIIANIPAAPTATFDTALLQNFPNRCNPETYIPFVLAEPSKVEIEIYDARGMLVRKLHLGFQHKGMHVSRATAGYWDGTNDIGEKVASGVYFYRMLTSNTATSFRRLVMVK